MRNDTAGERSNRSTEAPDRAAVVAAAAPAGPPPITTTSTGFIASPAALRVRPPVGRDDDGGLALEAQRGLDLHRRREAAIGRAGLLGDHPELVPVVDHGRERLGALRTRDVSLPITTGLERGHPLA